MFRTKLKLKLSFYVLIMIVIAFCTSSFTYKQVKIPLNNDNGVPFYKDEIDYYIDGFDIDKKGNFYFLGGENAILACFTGENLKFRKTFTEFRPNQIYLLDDKIYLFDDKFRKNNLFSLDRNSGNIISRNQNILKNSVNSFLFRDTSLIIEIFNNQKSIDMSTELGIVLFSLTGKFLKQVNNVYNLPSNLNPKSGAGQYLGQWNDDYVYWAYDLDNRLYKFILRNKKGEIIATQNIDEKVFGKKFYGNPIEHRKLRNGSIYILGRDEKEVIITELPLKELFNK